MENGKKYQVLAPAGSYDALVCAVNNGADAVYLGLDNFNARMKAENFNAQNIKQVVDFCHLFGVKVYVTVNVSVKNSELKSAKQTVLTAYNACADGVIVTDLALMRFCQTLPKPFEVVASTQLNSHDGYSARFLKNIGATTVVCARESTYANLTEIKQQGVNVESFIHGALCVCQSGQCLFSSMVGGNSGNRGLCAQPCRKAYACVNNGKKGYLLSTKDLCGVSFADKLLKAGATTFKIEGRNRRAEYAGTASAVYKRVFEHKTQKGDVDLLREMYNRGDFVADNYLLGNNSEIIYDKSQSHIGVVVGSIESNKLKTTFDIAKGDGFKVFDAQGNEICGAVALENGCGFVKIDCSAKVQNGCVVRRTTSVELLKKALEQKRLLPVSATCVAIENHPLQLTLTCGNSTVTVYGGVVQKATGKPTQEVEIAEQLCKTGGSCYTITNIVVQKDDIFLAKSQINAIRRDGLEKLQAQIICDYNSALGRKQVELHESNGVKAVSAKPTLIVRCYNAEQAKYALSKGLKVICKLDKIDAESVQQLTKLVIIPSTLFLDVPSFASNAYVENLLKDTALGVVAHNTGTVQMARESGLKYIVGTGLNIFNDESLLCFDDAETFFYSQELTLSEISSFARQDGIVFVDGELTLMKFVHCPYKAHLGSTCSNCKCCALAYKDELGNVFNIKRQKADICTFELTNGKKLSVTGRLKTAGRYCVDYDDAVIAHYLAINNGEESDYVEQKPYTKGRLYDKIY